MSGDKYLMPNKPYAAFCNEGKWLFTEEAMRNYAERAIELNMPKGDLLYQSKAWSAVLETLEELGLRPRGVVSQTENIRLACEAIKGLAGQKEKEMGKETTVIEKMEAATGAPISGNDIQDLREETYAALAALDSLGASEQAKCMADQWLQELIRMRAAMAGLDLEAQKNNTVRLDVKVDAGDMEKLESLSAQAASAVKEGGRKPFDWVAAIRGEPLINRAGEGIIAKHITLGGKKDFMVSTGDGFNYWVNKETGAAHPGEKSIYDLFMA